MNSIKKIDKHNLYFKGMNKRQKKEFLSIFGNKNYDNFLFDYIVNYSNIHPLDFFSFIKKHIFENVSIDTPLLVLTEERIKTTMDGHVFLKRYLGYIFEWHVFFSNKNAIMLFGKTSGIDIVKFQDNFKKFMDRGIYSNIFGAKAYLPSSLNLLKTDKLVKDNFYNNVFISLYHQEVTHSPLFMRTLAILSIFRNNFKEIKKIESFIIILYSLIVYVDTRGKFVFNLVDFIENGLKNISVKEQDLLDFFRLIGLETYGNYKRKVKHNLIKDYFPKKQSYNFLNIQLEIHKTPFVDISAEFGKKGWFIFDETFLLRKIYKIIGDFSIDDSGNKLDFGHVIEIFTYSYVDRWLKYDKVSKLDRDNYIIKHSLEFKGKNQGEIDFLIFNKKTSNLIIFESKDHIELNENLFKSGLVENLTKKNIPNRKTSGNIYKGISQLFKHSKRDINVIAKKLGDDIKINKIEYVFLNHHNTMLWNEVMRYFVGKNTEFNGFKYHFMSLSEFETFISIGCKVGNDFFNILSEKSEDFSNDKGYEVILERFKSYEGLMGEYETNNSRSLNQDFSIFFLKNYNHIKGDNFPFLDLNFLGKHFN